MVASILPLLIFSLVDQYGRYLQAREAGAISLSRVVADAIEEKIQSRFTALRVLALAPELQRQEFDRFRRRAEAVVAYEAPGSNILLLREDGQQMMNTAVPPETALPSRRDLTTLRRLFATGEPSISDLFFGIVVRRPVVAIEVPVKTADGQVIYGLTLNPTPDAFLNVIRRIATADAVVTVFDSSGTIVARTQDADRSLGLKAGEPLLSHLRSPGGILEAEGPGGTASVIAVSPVEPFGWNVAVEMPSAALNAAAWRSLSPTVIAGLLTLLAGIVIAALVAGSIARPIAALEEMTAKPARPDWARLKRITEVSNVAAALQQAHLREALHTEKLENTIAQRDLLLREVYHRVKNNLQVVDALIRMEFRRINDGRVLGALQHLLHRIHTLGLVHAQLMSSSDFKRFDVAVFLQELATNMASALSSDERRIAIRVESESVPVTIDFALPMGLLLTELIMNAAKHAYGDGEGEIRVRFGSGPDRQATLVVEDDGCSAPTAARFSSAPGLGAKIIAGFVKQLDGEVTFEFDQGMRFTAKMPLPEDDE